MFDNQKFRASAIGQIMSNGRAKNEMGETCKSYLKTLFIEKTYKIKKEFTNKYVEKGLAVEELAISTYSVFKGEFYTKNDEWYSNDYLSGTPDIVADLVIDVKSSWDIHTFPHFDIEIPNKGYYYQLQAYMELTGLKDSCLAYVLIDTPQQLVEDEKRRLSWKMGMIDSENPEYKLAVEEIERNHSYSHIPITKRIKEFEVKKDEQVIELIYKRISECRNYLNELC